MSPMNENSSHLTQVTEYNMTHSEVISKIRNRQVAKLMIDIDADKLPPMLTRSIKRSFTNMGNDFETYVTSVTGEDNEYSTENDQQFNR